MIQGSNQSVWSAPLANVKWHSEVPPVTVTSQLIRLITNFMTLIPNFTLIPNLTFTELWEVSMEYLQRVLHASRELLAFRTPGSIPFWDLHMFLLLRSFFLNLSWFSWLFHFEYPWGSVLSWFCILFHARLWWMATYHLSRQYANHIFKQL